MDRFIVLDAGPLRLATLQPHKPNADLCRNWLALMAAAGAQIVIPEIADYEVRRRHHKDGTTRTAQDAGTTRHHMGSLVPPDVLASRECPRKSPSIRPSAG